MPVQEGDVAETHNIRKFSSTDKFRSALRKLRKPSIYLRTLANDLLAPEEKKGGVCVFNEEEHQYREALRLLIRRVLLMFKQRRARKLEGFPLITRKRSRSPSKRLKLKECLFSFDTTEDFPEFWCTFSSETVVENLKELRVLDASTPTTTAFADSFAETTSTSTSSKGQSKEKQTTYMCLKNDLINITSFNQTIYNN